MFEAYLLPGRLITLAFGFAVALTESFFFAAVFFAIFEQITFSTFANCLLIITHLCLKE